MSWLSSNILLCRQSGRTVNRPTLALVFLMLAAIVESAELVAASATEKTTQPASERPLTTYERFLPLAVAGDPAIQHFLGYMYFFGEGVELDYDEAHYWFHLAAEEDDLRAQQNLGVFHSRAIPRIPEKFYDARESNLWFSLAAANPENQVISLLASQSYDKFLAPNLNEAVRASSRADLGETVYHAACAGCHGFNGHAAYAIAPSFARGDRLDKSDADLVQGILHGQGNMPAWGKILSAEVAQKIVSYIRNEFGQGAAQEIAPAQGVAESDTRELALGQETYLNFCGGCHGFNGIAWYVNSPSFALRERMNKSDAELANSIKNGLDAMPSWEYMLKPVQIDALVKFIRTLAPAYDSGIVGEMRRPGEFLRFRPKGESGLNWTADDLR